MKTIFMRFFFSIFVISSIQTSHASFIQENVRKRGMFKSMRIEDARKEITVRLFLNTNNCNVKLSVVDIHDITIEESNSELLLRPRIDKYLNACLENAPILKVYTKPFVIRGTRDYVTEEINGESVRKYSDEVSVSVDVLLPQGFDIEISE